MKNRYFTNNIDVSKNIYGVKKMETVFYNNKIYRVQQKKNSANDVYELYNYYLHNITVKWIDPLAALCVRIDFTGTAPSDANT